MILNSTLEMLVLHSHIYIGFLFPLLAYSSFLCGYSLTWLELDMDRFKVEPTCVWKEFLQERQQAPPKSNLYAPAPPAGSSVHSLLNLLPSFLLRETTLGFFVQVIGQFFLMSPPLLFGRHLVLSLTRGTVRALVSPENEEIRSEVNKVRFHEL